jgi:hypothetical protein
LEFCCPRVPIAIAYGEERIGLPSPTVKHTPNFRRFEGHAG